MCVELGIHFPIALNGLFKVVILKEGCSMAYLRFDAVCHCVCVCVCVRERERERECVRERERVCVCVCERERESVCV